MKPARICAQLFVVAFLAFVFFGRIEARAQQAPSLGEVLFTADTQDERDAGVWIDGKYAGYVKELKGDRKVVLPAGEHEISIRQAGYKEIVKKVVVDPNQPQTVTVTLETNTKLTLPGSDAAELRLDIQPKRAAVYMDETYMGHGGDFSGRFHSMLVAPGKHKLRVALDGYIPYEVELTAVANEKSRMNIALLKSREAPAAK